MPSLDYVELLAFAHSLADEARTIALEHFRQPTAIDQKADRTPVTIADRSIERALRDRIAARYPTHGLLGEEHGRERLDAEFVWVIDPIDGTKAFATGNPLFGCLIGLAHEGRPVVGVLDAPALGERYHAAVGHGSFRDQTRLCTRPTTQLADAVLYCTTLDALLDHQGHRQLRQQVRWTSYGADCLAYAFVAAGLADLVVDTTLQPYDWCALVPIVQEAGGVMTDWNGAALRLDGDGNAIAAGAADLLPPTVALLAD